jgi:CRISPR-associated endonuclease Csn1
MRLPKNDMVALGEGETRRVMRVVKFSEGQVTFAPHNEAGNLKARDADRNDAFKYLYAGIARLRQEKARKVSVVPAGVVRDPRPILRARSDGWWRSPRRGAISARTAGS